MNTGGLGALREAFAWALCCSIVFMGVYFADEITAAVSDTTTELANAYLPGATRAPAPSASVAYEAPARDSTQDSGRDPSTVYLMADNANQFYADAEINLQSIRVLVDTGASHVSLRHEDAETLGFFLTDKDFTHRAQTANGMARIAPVMLDRVQIGSIVVRDVQAFVGEPGKKFVTLLGMTFLQRLRSVNISGREMALAQ